MATNQTTGRITGVRTVGIPVRDQTRALEFYTETLGLEPRMDIAYGSERWIEVAPAGSTTTLALVRGPDQIQVGIDTQIRLTTEDAAAAQADFRARGVDVDDEILFYPVPMFTLRDPDGNSVVIVQQPAGS